MQQNIKLLENDTLITDDGVIANIFNALLSK